ncbi:MAG TPA: sulfatase-like hydrolase/transferase [Anaerolineales bacterium]|nr:sulfatase-like hydrolase/transferase [Anaerolineales bacterium]
MTQTSRQQPKKPAIFHITVLSAYFHVFMEWLFFITKPSALSPLSLFEKSKVLIVSGGVAAFVLLAALAILSVPARLIKNPKWKMRFSVLRFVPSALMLSVTALILLDNFTYTLFKFGIITTLGAWRIVYIAIFLLTFRWMFRFCQRTARTLRKTASFLVLGLLALSLAGVLTTYLSRVPHLGSSSIKIQSSAERPSIIILGADGLSAGYLSAYGYSLETTPFLNELTQTSLVAGNAFPNASSTTASTISALTGKAPVEVNVLRYPDVLTNEDSFEHLPGILKDQGYRTVQIGAPYYVDAEQVNMLNGFDIVNGNSLEQPALDALRAVLGNSPSTYFIQMIAERAFDRLLHIFFLEDMKNPFAEVNNPKVRLTDAERVDQIIDLLEQSDRPLFVFAHFMDTHGPLFSSEQDVFPNESTDDDQEWDMGRYKDAILSFDQRVQEIYSYLAQSGKLDDTILVIYTDHGYRYTVNQRIPIIIHFPRHEHAGIRRNNVQVMDIPVTLLDYLGISRPEWMTGFSMLGDEPPADRRIVSIVAGSPKKVKPPFYQIKTVQVVVCQKWYTWNVQENIWKSGMVRGHTAPCADQILPPDAEIQQMMLEYLDEHGFDTGSLR